MPRFMEIIQSIFNYYSDQLGLSQLARISLFLSLYMGLAGSFLDYVLVRTNWGRIFPKQNRIPVPMKHWLGVMLSRGFMGIVTAGMLWCLLGPDLSATTGGALRLIFLSGLAGLAAPALAESWRSRAVDWIDKENKTDNQSNG